MKKFKLHKELKSSGSEFRKHICAELLWTVICFSCLISATAIAASQHPGVQSSSLLNMKPDSAEVPAAKVDVKVQAPKKSIEPILPLRAWIERLKRELPARACMANSPTIKCYGGMDVDTCSRQLSSDIEICSSHNQLPKVINLKRMDASLAFKIGECAGLRFEKFNRNKLKDIPECGPRSN